MTDGKQSGVLVVNEETPRPPEHVTIDITAALREVFGETVTLVKDLTPTERICTTCKGLGIVKRGQNYGLGEHDKPSFPYEHQFVGHCPDCYGGVQRLCAFCHEPVRRGFTELGHDCQAARKAEWDRAREREAERIAQAPRVQLADYDGDMLYDDDDECFVYVSDGELESDHVYFATDPVEAWVKPSASELIEALNNEAADEWEDFEPLDVSEEHEAELQELVEGWFEKNIRPALPDKLYYANHNLIVEVPEPDYGDDEEDE